METGELIRYAMGQFRAERKERFVALMNGGRAMRTHRPNDRVLCLPNGDHVKVSVDDSGCATQVEEPEHLHAIARPHPIQANFGLMRAAATSSQHARPRPIKTALIPRRTA
jgi:hypothetical protein